MAPAIRVRLPRRPVTVLAAVVLLSALAGGSLGYFLQLELPDVQILEDYAPKIMTRVLSADGRVVDTFAEQKRILVHYRDIPKVFRDALVAVEDSNFFEHPGIDAQGIARAAWNDLRHLRLKQGASTLTMQLARDLFLHRQKTFRRKIQEALLALEIERNYTKEEILRFYCNQVYMGHGRYGLEAASRYYFGKTANDLTLPEAALLAGLIQRPEALTPVRHPDRAKRRRDHVLGRMVEVGLLAPEEADVARQAPVELNREPGGNDAPYFVEEVRRWLKAEFGDSSIYREGLEVLTTLDPHLQRLANRAMDLGLRQLDKRQGWRGAQARVPDGEDPETWAPDDWAAGIVEGRVIDGVVVSVDPERAEIRVGSRRGVLDAEDVAWTRRKSPRDVFEVGDVIRVRVRELGEDTVDLSLEQEPAVEAAIVVLDPRNGEVRAMVGGFDFERSEWNRATQSKRQPGSAFKPFVYAAALSNGWNLADNILDEPTVFLDAWTGEAYQPENYTNRYYGTLTLRRALEKSANIATVKLLDRVGYDRVISFARDLGITAELQPYPSLGLGAFGLSLLELTSAYGTFCNQGVRVAPHLIREVRAHDGTLLRVIDPGVRDAMSPQLAFLMNRSLAGVISDGTGRAAASLGRPLAGKTGTTDLNTDAWFLGYAPDLAVGVWVGFDDYGSLGSRETGALAALPIWKEFMSSAYDGAEIEDFPRPEGVSFVAIDRETGLRANPRADCRPVYSEAFVAGTEPTRYCSRKHHELLRMPASLQRYELNEQGELEIPSAELDAILASDLSITLSADGRALTARTPDGRRTMPVRRTPGGEVPALPDRLEGTVDPTAWVGRDGRPARIVLLERR